MEHAPLVLPPRCTLIPKVLDIISVLQQKNEKQRGVDIEQQYFLGKFSRTIKWILQKIVAPLNWMEHQVFTSSSPEVKSGYLWNPLECPNCHFMKNWPNYYLPSPQEEIFQKYWLVDGFRHDFMIFPWLWNLKCLFEEEILGKWDK